MASNKLKWRYPTHTLPHFLLRRNCRGASNNYWLDLNQRLVEISPQVPFCKLVKMILKSNKLVDVLRITPEIYRDFLTEHSNLIAERNLLHK